MKDYKILKAGDETLKQVAEPVTGFGSKGLIELIELLFHAMHQENGAGLAAPQIGISRRIFVYGIKDNPRYPTENPIPDTALINPEIIEYSTDTVDYYEGCLSLPTIRGLVKRPNSIVYKYQDVNGNYLEKEASGFESRAIQHELDHLDGKLFIERVDDLRSIIYTPI